ncbi:MAG: TatD family nuclease-associated radical SAM protein [Eubacteriales bacterium]|nr:TatD family nuclease-associated radical SAM protein [Eubacteriales bacterium]
MEKHKSMTIAYEVDGGLYLNITNRCPNNCTFCIRNNGDGAYGSDSLWLSREPTEDEIKDAIRKKDPRKFSEVVFCGYGEPSERLGVMVSVAKSIKDTYGSYLRVNTNGLSSLINGRDTAIDFAVFDCVSVSLNAPTAEKYQELCRSRYGKRAFDEVLDFTRKVKEYVPKVIMSIVKETQSDQEIAECIKICKDIGVQIKIRNYIGE